MGKPKISFMERLFPGCNPSKNGTKEKGGFRADKPKTASISRQTLNEKK